MALAIADNAFKNKFTSLAQIYNLIVPSTTDRIRLKWDDDWAKRPILRDVEDGSMGKRISKHRSMQYSKHRYYFTRLGRTLHYRKRFKWSHWRRGSGKKLNGTDGLISNIQCTCYR
jgi:hypothetical protein